MIRMEIKTEGYEIINKTVKASGNSGSIYVPKEWIGKKVQVILSESLEDNGD